MQSENVKEYQIIRKEMNNLKDCITTYMGFTLGGSGLVFIGLATTTIEGYPPIFASLLLSLIVSLVLLILYYKFNSHNRYAGYCKILNQERFEIKTSVKNAQSSQIYISDLNTKRDFMAWEICMDQLRFSDIEDDHLINMSKDVEIKNIEICHLREMIKDYSGRSPRIDNCKFLKGVKLILSSMIGRNISRSWQFPLYITLIFGTIVTTCVILAIYFYFLLEGNAENKLLRNSYVLIPALSAPIIFQFILWVEFIQKLYRLMLGSATVDAYCWKFLPIRYKFIQETDDKIDYNITSMREKD